VSLFLVKREDILTAVDNATNLVYKERDNLFNEEVDKLLNKWRWFFKIKTREEAEEIIHINKGWSDNWVCHGWGTLRDAESLYKALKVTDEKIISLSKKDAVFVEYWLNR